MVHDWLALVEYMKDHAIASLQQSSALPADVLTLITKNTYPVRTLTVTSLVLRSNTSASWRILSGGAKSHAHALITIAIRSSSGL